MGLMDNILKGKHLPILEGIDSLIGPNARFKGEINSNGALHINGEFEGKIIGDGEVIVSASGKVVGEIQGGSVVISGRVDGNIHARETVEITKSGRVHGDLAGGKVIISEGSHYTGRVRVESAAAEPPPVNQPSEGFPNF